MDIFVTLVHGLNLAAIYGLMAIGISLLWSSIGMINMAHGATFAVSGYAAWLVADLMKPVLLAAFGKTFLGTAAMAGLQMAEQALLVAVRQRIVGTAFFHPGGLELLQQGIRGRVALFRKFCNRITRHKCSEPP